MSRDSKTAKSLPPSAPFRAAEHLRNDTEIALYIEEMLADGDARAAAIALRTVSDALRRMNTWGVRSDEI